MNFQPRKWWSNVILRKLPCNESPEEQEETSRHSKNKKVLLPRLMKTKCPLEATNQEKANHTERNIFSVSTRDQNTNVQWNTWTVTNMTRLDSKLKIQRHDFADKGPSSQSYGFPSSHVGMWEMDHKEGWALKSWCFQLWCWRRLLRVPWTARRSD